MHLRFGEFELDSRRILLRRAGEKIALRPKVFDLLVHLAEHRDRVVPREELVAVLWGQTRVGAGSLSGLVNELRRALGERGRGPSSIRTVHARGYQFVANVQARPGEGTWREHPGLAGGLEADLDGPFGRVSGGVADALDRIRFGMGQVLREGPRAILFEAESRAGHAGLLDRALLLARHLDFEGIHLRWPDRRSDLATTSSGGLVETAIEACGARLGLEEGWASDPGVECSSPSAEPQIDRTRAVRGEADELAQLVIRSAGERPLLLAIEGFEGDPRPLLEGLIVGARSPSGREERPILLVVTSRRLERGDSRQASSGAARWEAAASQQVDPLDRVSQRIDSFRLLAPDRVHLDRWLRARGIDPLPEPLADALVRHLAGRSGSVEGVLDRLAHEGEAAALEVGRGSEGPEVPPATARGTGVMRRVPSDAGGRRRHDAEAG